MTEDLRAIIESLLFAAEGPLNLETLTEVIADRDKVAIQTALETLADEYEGRGGGFYLQQVAGGYQLRSRPRFHPWIRRLRGTGAPRLSRAALETLAIVAYRQPVLRAENRGGARRRLRRRFAHAARTPFDPGHGAPGDPRPPSDLRYHPNFFGSF